MKGRGGLICSIDDLIIFAKEILILIGNKWVDHEGEGCLAEGREGYCYNKF